MSDDPDLTRPQPFWRPFPSPETVFAGDVELARRHLHPLISIDLSAVDADLTGWVRLVSPIEPVEGYLGDGTEAFHSALASTNWIGFRVTVDDRYEFLGDWRYFRAASDDPEVHDDPELLAHYAAQESSFAATEAAFRKHGRLFSASWAERYGWEHVLKNPLEFIDVWGEQPGEGNWADDDLRPLTRIENDEGWFDAYPVTDDGRAFRFIAAVPGWHYRESGADSILLFFDPETHTALLTFDWT